ncbi:MAG: F0F1 ATP synthase subunit B [Armatimonadetes bacterium]|nr:F0F1 ATP synthase subunit B [Armatimonadota bacterium]
MSDQKQSSGLPAWVMYILGPLFMVGGFWVSVNVTHGNIKSLEEQGIPLDPGKTLAVIGVFLILFKVIESFYIMPLRDAIGTRNSDLESTFSEAENLRTQMADLKTDYERRLAATEADAREKIQAQIKEAQELRKTLMGEASAKADELVKRAQDEIAQERDRALAGIRLHVANLTLQATEKILSENMDNDRNRKLIDEFLDKVEVPTA